MFRSLSLAAVLLILPNFASTQEVGQSQVGSHEVVKGETLWALAEWYLANPFRWPMIFEANRDKIRDPHWIYPGQVFVIPGLEGQRAEVTEVSVVTEDAPVAPQPPDEERTVFYSGPSPGGSGGEPGATGLTSTTVVLLAAVPLGLVYASEWMEEPEVEAEWVGTLIDFSQVHAARTPRGRALWLERLVIEPREGVTLRVGDLLQSFVVTRKERGWGTVIRPTGILTVTAVEESGLVALLSAAFDQVKLGQRVRFAPDYDLKPGVFPQSVQSSLSGTILGFADERAMQGMGAEAFLDLGAQDGVAIGDEFGAYVNPAGSYPAREAAVLQVILVQEHTSTARIMSLTRPGLSRGDQVLLVGKMR
jgi:hypothetical protein